MSCLAQNICLKGKSEFIGRALARPQIRLKENPYHLPSLEWYSLYRGLDHAGELLAAFELLQVSVSHQKRENAKSLLEFAYRWMTTRQRLLGSLLSSRGEF